MWIDIQNNEFDYILKLDHEDINYVIILMFFKINNIHTYNVMFTTEQQSSTFTN